ncbi:MFS general substrate transporter [Cristinia sonorae]|uniref:MFS general substrate transporter n=1 Tax=Cristinia sonorae TaxID=1940300 RepID=A0A8K0UQ59_9AGAR|nr:MFS general substrate transporter [Cristinia sonorae]
MSSAADSERTHTPSQAVHPPFQIVTFSNDDPEDPKNWSKAKKRWVLANISFFAFVGVFGSSSYAPGEGQIRQLYGVNENVSTTGLTLYVLGFGLGPLLWGPLSEMYGKRLMFLISWVLMTVTIIPSAFVDNIVVILIFRLLTGICVACPLSNGAGVPADIYPNDLYSMARATGIFTLSALLGPVFGSISGFFLAAHSGRVLWVIRMQFFLTVAIGPLVWLYPETYGPTILEHRAKRLRKQGQTNARAMSEIHAKTTTQVIQGHVVRPLGMMVREPITQGAALWVALAYGILYFFFEAFPVVFIQQHGIPFQLCGLTFIGIGIGMVSAVAFYPYILRASQKIFIPGIERRGIQTPIQENNLKAALSAVILMPISLFWFAWSSGHEVYWLSAAFAGIPYGYAIVIIIFAFVSYLTQTYGVYATSAQSANTFVRSVVAAALPIAAHSLNENVGTKWGISIFGFISLGMIPIPLFFIRYGAAFRERSHFANEARKVTEKMRAQKEALAAVVDVTEEDSMEVGAEKKDDIEAQVSVSASEQHSVGMSQPSSVLEAKEANTRGG